MLGYCNAISSTPALAAALRQSHRRLELPAPFRSLLAGDPLVQMYRVPPPSLGRSKLNGNAPFLTEVGIDEEAQAAAHMLLAVADRLRRLNGAYGEWRRFDASAYFDLPDLLAERLVRVVERVSTVHAIFFADLLLPAFQTAEAFWLERYRTQYRVLRAQLHNGSLNGGAPLGPLMAFADHCQPQMVEHWVRLVQVVTRTRALLSDELGYWAASGGDDERARWQHIWQRPPAPGMAAVLLPDVAALPTLTLAVDFPLPAYRQPGRLRRLRRGREFHRKGAKHEKSRRRNSGSGQ
jgi:hypothetical protein